MLLRDISVWKGSRWYSHFCTDPHVREAETCVTQGASLYCTALRLRSGGGWERWVRWRGETVCQAALWSWLAYGIHLLYWILHSVPLVWYFLTDWSEEERCNKLWWTEDTMISRLSDTWLTFSVFIKILSVSRGQNKKWVWALTVCNLTEALLLRTAPSDICNRQISR